MGQEQQPDRGRITPPANPKLKDVEKLIEELSVEEQFELPLWRLVTSKILTYNDLCTTADLNTVVTATKMQAIKEGFMIAMIPEVINDK